MKVHRLFRAAIAAILGLTIGTIAFGAAAGAQDRRPHADKPVRASMYIRHLVQEGETLVRNDGIGGRGGIIQFYFGRRSVGDIVRLRHVGQNYRVIKQFCRTWSAPTDGAAPVCDEMRYSIRRSVGKVIEVPISMIPHARYAEIMAYSPTIARQMQGIAANAAPGGGTATAGNDATADADVAAADASPTADPAPTTGVDTGEGDAGGPDMAFALTDPDVAGTAAVPPPAPTPVPHGQTVNGNTGHQTGTGSGSGGATAAASVMPMAWGVGGWSAAGLLLLGCIGLLFTRSATVKTAVVEVEKPLDPETDPRTRTLRRDRDDARARLIVMTREKSDAEAKILAAASERAAAAERLTTLERAFADVQNKIRMVAKMLHAPLPEAILVHAQDVGDVISRLALAARADQTDLRALNMYIGSLMADRLRPAPAAAGPDPAASDKLRERMQRAVRLVLEKGRLAMARGREIAGLNASFQESLNIQSRTSIRKIGELEEQVGLLSAAKEDLEMRNREAVRRMQELEARLGIPSDPPPAAVPDEEQPPARKDETQVVVLESFADILERERELAAAAEAASGETEDEGPGDLPREQTRVTGSAPPEELPGEGTRPGVGLGEASGSPFAREAPTGKQTVGYEQLKPKSEEEAEAVGAAPVPPIEPLGVPALSALGGSASGGDASDAPANDTGDDDAIKKDDQLSVMCGCGVEFTNVAWEIHSQTCEDAGKSKATVGKRRHRPRKRTLR